MQLLLLMLLLLSYPLVEWATFVVLVRMGNVACCELSGVRKVLLALGLVILPAGMLMLANAFFDYPWHEKGVLGLWCIAGLGLLVALWHTRWLYRSKANLLLIAALAMICLCYTLWTLLAKSSQLMVVPLAACVNLTLLAVHVCRCGELTTIKNPFAKLLCYGKELVMTTGQLFAIVLIFVCAAGAWMILGTTIDYRTAQLSTTLSEEVNSLWGPDGLVQSSPCVVAGGIEAMGRGDYAEPVRSDIDVSFKHRNRNKGLLWFSTYTVRFLGAYTVQADGKEGTFLFKLPEGANAFENLTVTVDGVAVEPVYATTFGVSNTLEAPLAQGEHIVKVAYATRARGQWEYSSQWHTQARHGELKDFTLTARTDFTDIDYPKGSKSPITPAASDGDGMTAVWHYDSMTVDQKMGIEMPRRTNAGPTAARMSFFAPVSLFFFFTVLLTVVMLKNIKLHPMHYLFISAGFFAFHILMAYLVDVIPIHGAFWICAAVSTGLVVSYMRLVAGVKFAVLYVGLAQLVYLVGFSYAFFWVGETGRTITIGAIVTLFVLMQATGRLDWVKIFSTPPPAPPPLPNTPEPDAPIEA